MADPTINLATPIAPFSTVIDITTATTNENLLANRASSGKLIRIVHFAIHNADGSAAATASAWVYNQDGTGMNSDTGRNEVAIGSDVVAGSAIAEIIPAGLSVAAAGGIVIITRDTPYYLHEDESLVLQASAANDLTVTLTYEVIG